MSFSYEITLNKILLIVTLNIDIMYWKGKEKKSETETQFVPIFIKKKEKKESNFYTFSVEMLWIHLHVVLQLSSLFMQGPPPHNLS